jgi:heme A synthase
MNSIRRILWLFGLLAIFAGPLLAAEYTGRVVGVSDGSGACNQLQMK